MNYILANFFTESEVEIRVSAFKHIFGEHCWVGETFDLKDN